MRNTAARRWCTWKVRGALGAWGFLSSVLLGSCLQINADFTLPHQQAPGADASSGTTDLDDATREGEGTGADVTQSTTDDAASPSAGLSGESASDDSGPSGETSLASSSGELSSESSTSSQSTSSAPSVLWIPIEVRNLSSSGVLESQTSVRLQFNHASLVASEGARSDGANLQIIATDGSNETQLDRVLDPGSSWNSAQTQIWFSLDQNILAGQTQALRYYLVVHPLVTAPMADPARVFLAFDDFEGSSLNTSMWAAASKTEGSGTQGFEVNGGELVLTATATGSGSRAQTVRSVANWEMDAIAIDAVIRTTSNLSGGSDCTREFLTGFWSPSPSTYVRSLILHDREGYRYANHRDSDPYDFILQNTGSRLSTSSPRRYSMRWAGPNIEAAVDNGTPTTFFTRFSTFTEPSDGPLIAGFEAVALGGCPGVQSHLGIDWVIIRKAALAEPSLTLRLDQAARRDL